MTSVYANSSVNKNWVRLDMYGVGPRQNLNISLKFLNYSGMEISIPELPADGLYTN